MARVTTHSSHPSSARRRREIHIERDAAQKAERRTRKLRGEIHKAMTQAAQLVELSEIPTVLGPLRATDKKTREGGGWQIVGESGLVVAYADSRDKARKLAKEHNDGTSPIHELPRDPITHDAAMLQLGWQRVERDGQALAVEEKFVRVAAS